MIQTIEVDPLDSISIELADLLGAEPNRDARIARSIDQYEVVAVLEKNRRRISAEVSDRGQRIPRNLSLHRSRGTRRTVIGAPSFDRAIELFAPPVWALAVFGQATRSLVQVMIERWGAVVESGTIKLGYSGTKVPDVEVARTIRAAMQLARALSIEPHELSEALAKNAAADPEPAVRDRALSELITHDPERALEACRRALADPEPGVRLTAALGLEDEPAVEATLAELATTWGCTPEIRILAFERYLDVATDAIPMLERALADPVLAENAVYATVRFADPGWTDFLAEVFVDCDAQLRAAIAVVLAEIGHPKAESLLLAAPLAPAVVHCLAEMGTARAIPVLKRANTKPARDAIERIKARVGDLGGHVAIVGHEDREGALSEAEAGALSIDRED